MSHTNTKPTHDYLIIGAGMAGLTTGALLASSGYSVCMLEAHETAGGYAHTFSVDNFEFSAQVHYIWGCAPGETIYEFLKKINLHEEITFELFDPEGYDRAALPDGQCVKIPNGFDKLIENIESLYPGQRENLKQFIAIIRNLRDEMSRLPFRIRWWHYLTLGYKSLTLIKYKNKTLQNVFDECKLSKEAQVVLCAQAGDFGSPPEELSVLAYTGLFAGYNKGAYYPTKHFKFFIERIAQFISEQKNCEIHYSSEVNDILLENNLITGVTTSAGKTYRAKQIICNMDPQKAANIIGIKNFPASYRTALSYQYSPSSFVLYLGMKGIDLREFGFGNFNIWHYEQWDVNKTWNEEAAGNFDNPWLFISTPSLRTPDTSSTPEGCQNMEIGTLVNYDYFARLKNESQEKYQEAKNKLAEKCLNILEEKYVPNFRKYIVSKTIGTPLSNERFVWAPYGNCYGSVMTPENMQPTRLKSQTPWDNFHWCNASSGYAGIHGTILTGIELYAELTGEYIL